MIFIKAVVIFFLLFQGVRAQGVIHDNSTQGNLIIRITGFENNTGDCWFALDNDKNIFERDTSVYIGKILPIKNREVIIEINSLNFGQYAIKVFHDKNSNGKLDTDFLGIPKEDYGYSNNARSWFGPPSWQKAKFLFNQQEMKIEIKVE